MFYFDKRISDAKRAKIKAVERFADFLERNYYHAYFDIKDGAYWLTVVDNYGVDRIMFFGTFAEVYDHIKKY